MEPIRNAISIMRFSSGSDVLFDDFQRLLARWNRERLSPQLPDEAWPHALERYQRMLRLEGEFMETLRSEVADEAALAPTEAGDFLAWFEGLRKTGPGQGDPLFPWLASHASKEELRWFFEQEAAGEAGFDDLVEMTQVKQYGRESWRERECRYG